MKKLFSLILLLSFTIKAQDVKIGTQTWTTKNLNVTAYRNGDAIPRVKDNNDWANLTTGAWCYYAKNTANGIIYGKLYNWYAVNDPRGLVPKGYHMPSDKEWKTLSDYLGGVSAAGKKMKSSSCWENNSNGTNTSGFSGRPGGCRNNDGSFSSIGAKGYWWSSSEVSTNDAWTIALGLVSGFVLSYSYDKRNGYSVRCLKD